MFSICLCFVWLKHKKILRIELTSSSSLTSFSSLMFIYKNAALKFPDSCSSTLTNFCHYLSYDNNNNNNNKNDCKIWRLACKFVLKPKNLYFFLISFSLSLFFSLNVYLFVLQLKILKIMPEKKLYSMLKRGNNFFLFFFLKMLYNREKQRED